MLELFYNVYNLKDYFNDNSFKMYLFGNNGTYYYGFIDDENKKNYTLNIEYSKEFRGEVALIIDPGKSFPFKNKDKMFVVFNGEKVISILNRTYNRDPIELNTKKMSINGLDFFNVIKY